MSRATYGSLRVRFFREAICPYAAGILVDVKQLQLYLSTRDLPSLLGETTAGIKGRNKLRNVLVTGAAGFIGSAVARRLIELGEAVTTIDNLSTGSTENIPSACAVIIGDASDPGVLATLGDRHFDVIFHIAGQSGGIPSFQDPVCDLHSNVTSTLRLLDIAHRSGCSTFVYASSMAVYGDPDTVPVSEDASLRPKSFYAVAKMASEHYLRLYADYGMQCTALRLNNVYGPGQDLSNLNQGMVSIFLGQAIENRHIHVKGSSRRFRDFVYIDDVVESFVRVGIGGMPSRYTTYNVATARATTVEELIEILRRNLPFDIEVRYEGSTPGDQFGITCSYKRIAFELGWRPTVGIEEGLATTCTWATNHRSRL
jgi:UDP-glucose 4-epimerase